MPQKPLRLYIIAGEASGDLHGSHLMRSLKNIHGDIEFRFWGGDNMIREGGDAVKHIRELAFMGFVEVLFNLSTILKNIRFCKHDIETFQPDALILIDYPGFNMRIAKWAKTKGLKVFYYISPQIWAWKQSRVHEIKRSVDKMFVILPFEKEFYKKFHYDVEYVGNPLVDVISAHRRNLPSRETFLSSLGLTNQPIIALLPGSRKQEIQVKLPIMLEAVKQLRGYQVVIAGAPNADRNMYIPYLQEQVHLVMDRTYDILHWSDAALVTSGTATLETAIIGCPQVVCYKGSYVSFLIARMLIKVPYISLVNLIMEKEVVKELIQDMCNSEQIGASLRLLLENDEKRQQLKEDYDHLRKILGQGGASEKVAYSVLKTIIRLDGDVRSMA
jgi:lipid-A-disaccharide synthase